MNEQAYARAHLRPLERCWTCGKPATKRLYNGVNAPMSAYCDRHAKSALQAFQVRDSLRREIGEV